MVQMQKIPRRTVNVTIFYDDGVWVCIVTNFSGQSLRVKILVYATFNQNFIIDHDEQSRAENQDGR